MKLEVLFLKKKKKLNFCFGNLRNIRKDNTSEKRNRKIQTILYCSLCSFHCKLVLISPYFVPEIR